MQRASLLGLGLVVLLAIAATGCLFDPDRKTDPPPPPAMPFPDTPDQLTANFKTAYSGMKLNDYAMVLAPQFGFVMNANEAPLGHSNRFDRAEELGIAGRMFSGHSIPKPDGTTVIGISGISFPVFSLAQPWTDVGADDPYFPSTKRGLYDVQIVFAHTDAGGGMVHGQQEFYVSSRDSLVHGVVRPFFQLRGQRDLSQGGKASLPSWGGIKALFFE